MLLPANYLLEEGKEAPEGTTVKECKYCHAKFAIPNDQLDNYKGDVCEGCQAEADKEAAQAAAALMKPPTDAASTIQTALGK